MMKHHPEERRVLTDLFQQVAQELEKHPDWENRLPLVKSAEFQHTEFGLITFSLRLTKRLAASKNEDITSLRFEITQRETVFTRSVSFGKSEKVKQDIVSAQEIIEALCVNLPQMYMSIFDYPRPTTVGTVLPQKSAVKGTVQPQISIVKVATLRQKLAAGRAALRKLAAGRIVRHQRPLTEDTSLRQKPTGGRTVTQRRRDKAGDRSSPSRWRLDRYGRRRD